MFLSKFGAIGTKGDRGARGVSVSDIAFNRITNKITVTFSNGATLQKDFAFSDLGSVLSDLEITNSLSVMNGNAVVLSAQSNAVTVGVDIQPVDSGTSDVGSSYNVFRNVYTQGIHVMDSCSNSNSLLTMSANSNSFGGFSIYNGCSDTTFLLGFDGINALVNQSLAPLTTNSLSMGNPDNQYSGVYSQNFEIKKGLCLNADGLSLYGGTFFQGVNEIGVDDSPFTIDTVPTYQVLGVVADSGAVSIILPNGAFQSGVVLTIKSETTYAHDIVITVADAGTIQGNSSYTINTDYGVVRLVFIAGRSTGWFII